MRKFIVLTTNCLNQGEVYISEVMAESLEDAYERVNDEGCHQYDNHALFTCKQWNKLKKQINKK